MYRKWAQRNNFESKLKADKDARKQAANASASQTTLDASLTDVSKEHPLPYSDASFRRAIAEWVIATDQVRYMLPQAGFR